MNVKILEHHIEEPDKDMDFCGEVRAKVSVEGITFSMLKAEDVGGCIWLEADNQHYSIWGDNLKLYKNLELETIRKMNDSELNAVKYIRKNFDMLIQGKIVDIKSPEEEQALLAVEQAKRDKAQYIEDLKRDIQERGVLVERVNGQMISQPKGEVLSDTFTIYGSGECLIETETELWYLINNGGDDDCWDWNTVSTGGAGAYGWRLKKEVQPND